jgi:hypothetical protein
MGIVFAHEGILEELPGISQAIQITRRFLRLWIFLKGKRFLSPDIKYRGFKWIPRRGDPAGRPGRDAINPGRFTESPLLLFAYFSDCIFIFLTL